VAGKASGGAPGRAGETGASKVVIISYISINLYTHNFWCRYTVMRYGFINYKLAIF
jgi:hypothetical protein